VIQLVKKDHWNIFLKKKDTITIFKAMSYMRDRRIKKISSITSSAEVLIDSFQDKASIFQSTLFLKPSISANVNWENYTASTEWDWSVLSTIELKKACFTTTVKDKTSESDKITQEIIAILYKAILNLFDKLYANLLNIRYHSKC